MKRRFVLTWATLAAWSSLEAAGVSRPNSASQVGSRGQAPRFVAPQGFPAPYVTPLGIRLLSWFNRSCLWSVRTQEKVIALTFDDGPSAESMPRLLDVLMKHRFKATFFVLGDRFDDPQTADGRQRRAALRRAAEEGHEIAFHGWKHRSLYGVPDKVIAQEMRLLRQKLAEVAGTEVAQRARFFRPPFGAVNGRISAALAQEGLQAVNASILPGDYYLPRGWAEDPQKVARRVPRELHPGAILCLHVGDDLGQNDGVYDVRHAAEIVERLAPMLEARGYRVTRLGDLVPAPVPMRRTL